MFIFVVCIKCINARRKCDIKIVLEKPVGKMRFYVYAEFSVGKKNRLV